MREREDVLPLRVRLVLEPLPLLRELEFEFEFSSARGVYRRSVFDRRRRRELDLEPDVEPELD